MNEIKAFAADLPAHLRRALTAWAATASALLISTAGSVTDKALGRTQPAALLIGGILLIYAALSVFSLALRRRRSNAELFENAALGVTLLVYALAAVRESGSVYLALGVTAALTVAALYLLPCDRLALSAIRVGRGASVAFAAAAALVFVLFVGSFTAARYLTFSSPNFDFGIFCNMFYNMKESFSPVTTCERDMLLSHFAVHMSPIYYLLLPFYMVFPSPLTLQVGQAVVLASGVLPLYLLCRSRKLSYKATAVFCAVFCAAPALAGGCCYDLHENCFLPPLILWLFWSVQALPGAVKHKKLRFWLLPFIFSALILLVKEDAAIYVAFAAIYLFADAFAEKRPDRRAEAARAAAMFALAVIYFAAVSWVLSRFGMGVMSSRYANFTQEGEGLGGIFRTLLGNPALAIAEAFEQPKLLFAVQLIVPLAALPLLTKKPHRLLLLAPMLLLNLMTDYRYQYSLYFQYVFGPLAFLVTGAVLNFAELSASVKRCTAVIALAASLTFSAALTADRLGSIADYAAYGDSYRRMEELLDTIPSDASVTASTFLLPHIADRREIYELQYTDETTEYIAIDTRGADEEKLSAQLDAYKAAGYSEFRGEDGLLIVLHKIS